MRSAASFSFGVTLEAFALTIITEHYGEIFPPKTVHFNCTYVDNTSTNVQSISDSHKTPKTYATTFPDQEMFGVEDFYTGPGL
jgi:hypothetical protein